VEYLTRELESSKKKCSMLQDQLVGFEEQQVREGLARKQLREEMR